MGISLTDQPDEFCGNLTVYPGSHHLINKTFLAQWHQQEAMDIAESERKLGPGQLNWDDGKCVPNGVLDTIEPVQLRLAKGNQS